MAAALKPRLCSLDDFWYELKSLGTKANLNMEYAHMHASASSAGTL